MICGRSEVSWGCIKSTYMYVCVCVCIYIYIYIAHLPQQCHNSKIVIFQERLLKVLKCYNFLWVQRRHNCSPAASLANCVMTLCLLKMHLQTFLSTQKPKNAKFWFVALLTQMSNICHLQSTIKWPSGSEELRNQKQQHVTIKIQTQKASRDSWNKAERYFIRPKYRSGCQL